MTTFRFDLNDEYSQKLTAAAAENKMNVQDYIRFKLFNKKTIFTVEEIIERIQKGDFLNKEFTIPDVFSPEEWSEMEKGPSGVLGRNFYSHITENPDLGIRFVPDKKIKRRAVYTYVKEDL